MVSLIYLDNAATTKIDPRVLDEMMPYLKDEYGNPGGVYSLGRRAQCAVETARNHVASLIGAEPDQIIFTSGGSEANNLAVKSFLGVIDDEEIITDEAEHDSLLNAVDDVDIWHKAKYVPVGLNGSIEFSAFCDRITENTKYASIMCMNNETGAVNPIEDIGRVCAENGILFHTDCVQAAGSVELDVKKFNCDFMSISSHKIHGPKGVGALFVRNKLLCNPLINGGSAQEFGLRGGTENVAGIVGFGKACEILRNNFAEYSAYTSSLKQMFYKTLVSELSLQRHGFADIIHVNGPDVNSVGKTINLRFDGVDGQTLLLMLDAEGICVSAGSACTSRENNPSHVLVAMGIPDDDARNSVRISFSRMNTKEEVRFAAKAIAACVNVLKKC